MLGEFHGPIAKCMTVKARFYDGMSRSPQRGQRSPTRIGKPQQRFTVLLNLFSYTTLFTNSRTTFWSHSRCRAEDDS